MSADNYWFVRKHEGKYVLSMEFASDESPSDVDWHTNRRFDTLDALHAFLDDPITDNYTEYGLVYDFPTRTVEVKS